MFPQIPSRHFFHNNTNTEVHGKLREDWLIIAFSQAPSYYKNEGFLLSSGETLQQCQVNSCIQHHQTSQNTPQPTNIASQYYTFQQPRTMVASEIAYCDRTYCIRCHTYGTAVETALTNQYVCVV